jgi:hypothetical protein
MPTVRFNIGEAFQANDHVARFITSLAMISNDVNRSIDMFDFKMEGADPDAMGRQLMLFRQLAALYFEAADFIKKSSPRFNEIQDFIADLPEAAKDEYAQIVGSVDHKSPHYLGDWLEELRNNTFHYRELHPAAAANGDEVIMKALESAADKPGVIFVGEVPGKVRFGFADQVVASGLVPGDDDRARATALRESLLTVVCFTQGAFAAYRDSRPAGTFAEQA